MFQQLFLNPSLKNLIFLNLWQHISTYFNNIIEHPTAIAEYKNRIVRRLIGKVTVYENKIHRRIQVRLDGGCG